MRRLLFLFCVMILSFQSQALNSDTKALIREAFLVPNITIDFNDDEIGRQISDFSSAINFVDAAKLAFKSFMTDGSDEESPLACLGKENLHDQLNNSLSVFGLVGRVSELMPERGEKLENNWVFYLHIDSYDFTFWAIVDRAGNNKVYNYGLISGLGRPYDHVST